MVKPKRTLADDFAPRQPAETASMRDTLAPSDAADPLRHLTVQVPDSLRHRIKMAAVEQKQSVRDLVTQALQNHLESLDK